MYICIVTNQLLHDNKHITGASLSEPHTNVKYSEGVYIYIYTVHDTECIYKLPYVTI